MQFRDGKELKMTLQLEESNKFTYKYAPQKISDMILSDNLKTEFQNMLNTKQFRDFSLIAGPGIGKTTLAKTLAKEAGAEVLFMACAAGDGKVEAIQTKLIPFVQSMPIDNQPMFVIFDEIDSASASQDSSFQKALRNVIEKYPGVVYIATANYGQKIIKPLLSRCRQINLQFTPKDVIKRFAYILEAENVKYDKESLKNFVQVAVKTYYPDIRQMLDFLQSCCVSGKLVIDQEAIAQNNKTEFTDEVIDMATTGKDLLKIREYYTKRKTDISDFAVFASEIFKRVLDLGEKFKELNKDVIIKLADVIYQMNLTVDKEVSFFQFITVLSKLQQKENK